MRNIFWLFLAILVFCPLAFGTVEPWSLAVMEVLSIAALCLFFYMPSKAPGPIYYKVPGILPLACFIAYIFLQMIPLPADLIRVVSPKAYEIYSDSAGSGAGMALMPLTVNLKLSLAEFIRYSSYAAFYILTVQLLARKGFLKQTVLSVVFFASLLAVFGIIQQFTSGGKIYWTREISTKLFYGPFANRNHFAGLMDMIFPVALGLFLALKPAISYESLRSRLADMINQRELNNHILVGIGAVIIATSVFLSLSRGGMACLFLSLLFMSALLFFRTREIKRSRAILIISLFVVLIVGWVGWGQVISRFDDLQNETDTLRMSSGDRPDRAEMWKDSAAVAADFAATGSGMGSFARIYPKYRAFWTDYLIDHAHNDYLELLIEGGIIAFLTVAAFLLTVFYKTYRTILLRRDNYSIYVYIGCVTGIMSILIFGLTDFNMHIGSNGLYYFFLAGLAVSAANTRLHRGTEPTYLEPMPEAHLKMLRLSMPALLVICIVFNAGMVGGDYFSLPVKNARSAGNSGAHTESLREASDRSMLVDPLEANYYFTSGMLERQLFNRGEAIRLFGLAAALDPLNGEYLQRLGLSLYEAGQTSDGDRLIRAGTRHDIANPAMYRFYAIHLFSTGRKEQAADSMKQALLMAPDRADDLIMLMMIKGLSDDEIWATLPDRAVAHISFANYLAQAGKHPAAEKAYRDALVYASAEKKAPASYFLKASEYFIKRELFEEALGAIKLGIGKLPADSLLHYTAGTLYERLNMNSAAIEAYRRATSLDITRTDAYTSMEALMRKSGKP